eukprot:COSAG02_NODE_40782_length_401_cov_1.192053_1_plen_29_part_10
MVVHAARTVRTALAALTSAALIVGDSRRA